MQFQLTSNHKNSHIKYLGIKGLSCTETMQSQHKQIKYPAVIRKHLRWWRTTYTHLQCNPSLRVSACKVVVMRRFLSHIVTYRTGLKLPLQQPVTHQTYWWNSTWHNESKVTAGQKGCWEQHLIATFHFTWNCCIKSPTAHIFVFSQWVIWITKTVPCILLGGILTLHGNIQLRMAGYIWENAGKNKRKGKIWKWIH